MTVRPTRRISTAKSRLKQSSLTRVSGSDSPNSSARHFAATSRSAFDNAEEMLRDWRHCFENIEQPGTLSDHEDETTLGELLASATLDTQVHELGLGTRAANVLDRANLLTVEDLLTVPMRRLSRFRGVGNKTRREIVTAVKILRERLGSQASSGGTTASEEESRKGEQLDPGSLGIDMVVQRMLPRSKANATDKSLAMIRMLLGLSEELEETWPSQTDVAEISKVTRARVSQVAGKFQEKWAKEPAVTKLRAEIAGIIEAAGGVMVVPGARGRAPRFSWLDRG